jgi:MFS transporter, FSR family, fosmidomycin resistance protein
MESSVSRTPQELAKTPRIAPDQTVMAVLFAISFSHLLNDTIQALLPSIYPLLKDNYRLTFAQLGLITFTFQFTASLLQPVVGWYTDRRPYPWSLAVGMGFTLLGLVALAFAHSFPVILGAAALVGIGSSIFHPEASRIAHMAAGKRRGFAQSVFQVGGNAGSSIGPLLAAAIIVPHGQAYVAVFSIVAFVGVVLLWRVGGWQSRNLDRIQRKPTGAAALAVPALPRKTVAFSLLILAALIFSKYFYLASMSSYYTFYLIDRFHVSIQQSQLCLFVFLFSVAAGTILGGPIGDKFGRKRVIWASILGVAPFTLWLPHASLPVTIGLTVIIGIVLASAFSAILVYAQELMPGKVGMIAGLFFGFAFGMGGIGSALLGKLADHTSIQHVFNICAYLPLIGMLTALLPNVERKSA